MLKRLCSRFLSSVMLIFCLTPTSVFGLSAQRKLVVDYMEAMADIIWTPENDLRYWNEKYGIVYKKGFSYMGIPYTQISRDTGLGNFNELTVVKDGKRVYVGENKDGKYFGNDCSSAVRAAWLLVNPTGSFSDTGHLGKTGEVVGVGPYNFDFELFETKSTSDICSKNGEEKMFKSYKELKPGDVVLSHTRTEDGKRFGHVSMVTEVDKEKNLVFIVDQAGVGGDGALYSKGGRSSWRHESLRFDVLYSKGYIPLANAKLVESDIVDFLGDEVKKKNDAGVA